MLEEEQAFNMSKNDLAQAALLAYPAPNAEIFLAADTSDTAVDAVLYQKIDNRLVEPLGFFSNRLDRAQIKWTIFSRELLAIYLGAKHFSYFLQGTSFTSQTDHQAIVNAAASSRPRDILREVRHLHYLTIMRPNWQHITSLNNVTADAFSRATAAKQSTAAATLSPMATDSHSKVSTLFFINVPDQDNNEYKTTINSITNTLKKRQYEALIAHQKNDPELKQLVKNSDSAEANNKLKLINNLLCIEENNNLRIYVPHPLCNILLHDLHDTAHPGVRNTLREAQQ